MARKTQKLFKVTLFFRCARPFAERHSFIFILFVQDSRSLNRFPDQHCTHRTRDSSSFQMFSTWSTWLSYALLGRALCTMASPTTSGARSLSVELLDVLEDLADSQPATDISRLSAVIKSKSAQIDAASNKTSQRDAAANIACGVTGLVFGRGQYIAPSSPSYTNETQENWYDLDNVMALTDLIL